MPTAETNGITTHYEDTGAGPDIVFIHGHSLDHTMWDYQIEAVTATGFRAIRYDMRGHGKTSAPPTGYTWDNYTADLDALLDHLAVESAHLVGCSMGGGLALHFALTHTARVRSLTLVDSTLPGFTYSPEFGAFLQELRTAARLEGVKPAFERLWLAHPFFDGARRHPERFATIRESVLAFPASEYTADYPGEIGYEQPDVASRLTQIAAPALVIAGENDLEDFLLIAEVLASTIPNARLVTLPDTWHLPSVERPEEFNALLLEFLTAIP